MSAKLGPDPLPTTIARAHVREHRSLFCSNYDTCLALAAREDWTSWTCAHCARFHAPPRLPRRPAAFSPIAEGNDVVAAASETGARERHRSRPGPAVPPHGGHADPSVPAHFVERENGAVHVRLEAPCLTALFIEAARAVAEVVRGRPLEPVAPCGEEVSIIAPDREHLLVAWMAELVVRSERSSAWFTEFDIVYLSDRQIVASIRGVRVAQVRPSKVAKYHDPCLVGRGGHFSANPVLDV